MSEKRTNAKLLAAMLIACMALLSSVHCKDNADREMRLVRGRKVFLRTAPEKKATPIGLLAGGVQVSVIEHAAESITIDGLTAPWTRVEVLDGSLKGSKGWIFGGYLSPPGFDPWQSMQEVIESDAPASQKVTLLQNLRNEYESFGAERGDLYSFTELLDNAIMLERCWNGREADGFTSEAALRQSFQSLIADYSDQSFRRMSSCEFYALETCGGTDVLPFPLTEEDLQKSAIIVPALDRSSADDEHCYSSKDGHRYCFSIGEVRQRYFIHWMCRMP